MLLNSIEILQLFKVNNILIHYLLLKHFKDDDGSINADTKQVNPSSLIITEGLQPTNKELDKILDASVESDDTVSINYILYF